MKPPNGGRREDALAHQQGWGQESEAGSRLAL